MPFFHDHRLYNLLAEAFTSPIFSNTGTMELPILGILTTAINETDTTLVCDFNRVPVSECYAWVEDELIQYEYDDTTPTNLINCTRNYVKGVPTSHPASESAQHIGTVVGPFTLNAASNNNKIKIRVDVGEGWNSYQEKTIPDGIYTAATLATVLTGIFNGLTFSDDGTNQLQIETSSVGEHNKFEIGVVTDDCYTDVGLTVGEYVGVSVYLYITPNPEEDLSRIVRVYEQVLDLIYNKIKDYIKIKDIDNMASFLLPYQSEELGWELNVAKSTSFQRKWIKILVPMYKQKGTKIGIKNILYFLTGFKGQIWNYFDTSYYLEERYIPFTLTGNQRWDIASIERDVAGELTITTVGGCTADKARYTGTNTEPFDIRDVLSNNIFSARIDRGDGNGWGVIQTVTISDNVAHTAASLALEIADGINGITCSDVSGALRIESDWLGFSIKIEIINVLNSCYTTLGILLGVYVGRDGLVVGNKLYIADAGDWTLEGSEDISEIVESAPGIPTVDTFKCTTDELSTIGPFLVGEITYVDPREYYTHVVSTSDNADVEEMLNFQRPAGSRDRNIWTHFYDDFSIDLTLTGFWENVYGPSEINADEALELDGNDLPGSYTGTVSGTYGISVALANDQISFRVSLGDVDAIGCGTAAVNGTFSPQGTYQSKTYYRHTTNPTWYMFIVAGTWYIAESAPISPAPVNNYRVVGSLERLSSNWVGSGIYIAVTPPDTDVGWGLTQTDTIPSNNYSATTLATWINTNVGFSNVTASSNSSGFLILATTATGAEERLEILAIADDCYSTVGWAEGVYVGSNIGLKLIDMPGDTVWSRYMIWAELQCLSGGVIGVIGRYQDADNYYAAYMDINGFPNTINLIKVVNGAVTILDTTNYPSLAADVYYNLALIVDIGNPLYKELIFYDFFDAGTSWAVDTPTVSFTANSMIVDNGAYVLLNQSVSNSNDWTHTDILFRINGTLSAITTIYFRMQLNSREECYRVVVNFSNNIVYLYKNWIDAILGPQTTILGSSTLPWLITDVYHHIWIENWDDNLKVYVNGDVYITAIDSEWEYGNIGFETSGASGTSTIGAFQILKLNDCVATTTLFSDPNDYASYLNEALYIGENFWIMGPSYIAPIGVLQYYLEHKLLGEVTDSAYTIGRAAILADNDVGTFNQVEVIGLPKDETIIAYQHS